MREGDDETVREGTLHQAPTDPARLAHIVGKHRTTTFRKPPAPHTVAAYEGLRGRLLERMRDSAPCILDSCCGTALSTKHLAELHPDALVIGIDRSTVRLEAAPHLPVNALVLRAECADFWELCVRDDVVFALHAIYYPNPYPKSEHLGRRWHGHAAFPTLLRISAAVELRSNMPWYAREFSAALRLCGVDAPAEEFEPDAMMTAFERKYAATGHALWRVHARIPSAIREKLTPRGSSVSM